MHNTFLILLRIAPLFFLTAGDAMARAGGAGGSGTGSFKIKIGLWIVGLIYAAIHTAVLTSKSRRSDELLGTIAARDGAWDSVTLKMRIRAAFDTVQTAWMQRDQEIARDYMSEALYLKHKGQTDEMLQDHERNILQQIKVDDIRIVGIQDYEDNARDQFWAFISGSMIDYTVDDRTQHPIKGSVDDPESFCELWKFIRTPRGWVVDEIEPKAGVLSLSGMDSYSEAVATADRAAHQHQGRPTPST